MSANLLLYVLMGVVLVSTIASQRLVGAKPATGPAGALILTTFCRFLTVVGWVWFGFLTGYWQIPVMMLVGAAVIYAGMLAKKATS